MEFEDFSKVITNQIADQSATVDYGCIRTEYQQVLVIKDGKIVCIGEFIYRIFRESLCTKEDLIEFGKACERHRKSPSGSYPSFCYRHNKLSF